MSRFINKKFSTLEAYTPGEQPRDMQYIKLNTNESPFAPSPLVLKRAGEEAGRLNLYSDPTCQFLREKAAELFGVGYDNVLPVNGSDEILDFAFLTFGGEDAPFVFPDITYGFYPVYAQLYGIPYEEIPLKDDFTIDYREYCGIGKNIVIANPNAPTGIVMPLSEIEEIIKTNPDNIVIIDEAYINFGGETAIPLIKKYKNLLITRTFSKSHSLAGARLGFGIGDEELIADLNKIKYSTNPYNINRMTAEAGEAAIIENDYYMENCRKIIEIRGYVTEKLRDLGFTVLDSSANFIFAGTDKMDGESLYLSLKERGILVRHFSKERIKDFLRITIGSREQMDALISAVSDILNNQED